MAVQATQSSSRELYGCLLERAAREATEMLGGLCDKRKKFAVLNTEIQIACQNYLSSQETAAGIISKESYSDSLNQWSFSIGQIDNQVSAEADKVQKVLDNALTELRRLPLNITTEQGLMMLGYDVILLRLFKGGLDQACRIVNFYKSRLLEETKQFYNYKVEVVKTLSFANDALKPRSLLQRMFARLAEPEPCVPLQPFHLIGSTRSCVQQLSTTPFSLPLEMPSDELSVLELLLSQKPVKLEPTESSEVLSRLSFEWTDAHTSINGDDPSSVPHAEQELQREDKRGAVDGESRGPLMTPAAGKELQRGDDGVSLDPESCGPSLEVSANSTQALPFNKQPSLHEQEKESEKRESQMLAQATDPRDEVTDFPFTPPNLTLNHYYQTVLKYREQTNRQLEEARQAVLQIQKICKDYTEAPGASEEEKVVAQSALESALKPYLFLYKEMRDNHGQYLRFLRWVNGVSVELQLCGISDYHQETLRRLHVPMEPIEQASAILRCFYEEKQKLSELYHSFDAQYKLLLQALDLGYYALKASLGKTYTGEGVVYYFRSSYVYLDEAFNAWSQELSNAICKNGLPPIEEAAWEEVTHEQLSQ